jgi:hypothetical protein
MTNAARGSISLTALRFLFCLEVRCRIYRCKAEPRRMSGARDPHLRSFGVSLAHPGARPLPFPMHFTACTESASGNPESA